MRVLTGENRMTHDDASWHRSARNGAGDAALTSGMVSMVFALVPLVGDVVALPAAVAAVVLGLLGIFRADRGEATNGGKALTGTLLGAVTAFITLLTVAATGAAG
jgi:hypothetical protein